MPTAFIGLGSNIDAPVKQLQRALSALVQLPDSCLQKVSPFYETKPMGDVEQPNFINAVAQLQTILSPFRLLLHLQKIEHQQGRVRSQHWGPRTLDLDILCYNQLLLKSRWLTLPHPGLLQRTFVLRPFAAIAPDWLLPNGCSIKHSLAKNSRSKFKN